MDGIAELVGQLSDAVWTWLLVPVVVGVALYLTVRSGVAQLRWLPEMVRTLREPSTRDASGRPQSISAFQAFTLSAASRVGVGNIAGVGTAIAVGGAGAVLWMWLMAFLVGASSLVESALAQLFKVRDRGSFRGGPAYYIERGLGSRRAAVLFAVILIVCFPFAFNSLQANTFAQTVVGVTGGDAAPDWVPWLVGASVALLTALVIFGGLRRIAHVSQATIPLVALVYLLVGLVVVAMHADRVPAALAAIVTEAWGGSQVAGATLGTIIMTGVRRGMFSNEAGLGSVPNAAATAAVTHPVKQGLVQTLGVYFDTWLVCSITAFIILVPGPDLTDAPRGVHLTQTALADTLGSWTGVLLAVIIFLLAFTSILGNYYYGEANLRYISDRRSTLRTFRVLVVVVVLAGSVASADLVWDLADGLMAVMALINLVALLLLSRLGLALLRDYAAQRRDGLDPVFTRARLPAGVTGVECWEDEESVRGGGSARAGRVGGGR